MPDVFGHSSTMKLVSAAGIAPAIPRSQAERVAPTLRADGGPEGTCTLSLPADNGLLRSLSYGSELARQAVAWQVVKWSPPSLKASVGSPREPRRSGRRLVGGAGNAPVVTSDVCFATPDLQSSSRNTSQIGSGGRNYTGLKRFMRPSSVL